MGNFIPYVQKNAKRQINNPPSGFPAGEAVFFIRMALILLRPVDFEAFSKKTNQFFIV
jgi:hypothetical protein